MLGLEFDTTIGLEGAATAIGVLGAAAGYIFSLIDGGLRRLREGKYRGTKFVILTILEKHPINGMEEQEIFSQYDSSQNEKLRKGYGAWKPGKLDAVEFERLLKQLQTEFMIDLIGPDRYRLRQNPVRSYEFEESARSERAAMVESTVSEDEIAKVLLKILREASSDFDREDAARTLLDLKNQESLEYLTEQMKSADNEQALAAARILVRTMKGRF
ncbi:hypothetical protein [Ruegeria sp. HKCCD7255]|uniref:hypothetical protein n=1 Tax=Ruegeria sp. HKCCD7255 TaxID=2683004 RepID=UPI0014883BC9|nr:hypothetical protein [Ruegeria sp. HKCCD7255]